MKRLFFYLIKKQSTGREYRLAESETGHFYLKIGRKDMVILDREDLEELSTMFGKYFDHSGAF